MWDSRVQSWPSLFVRKLYLGLKNIASFVEIWEWGYINPQRTPSHVSPMVPFVYKFCWWWLCDGVRWWWQRLMVFIFGPSWCISHIWLSTVFAWSNAFKAMTIIYIISRVSGWECIGQVAMIQIPRVWIKDKINHWSFVLQGLIFRLCVWMILDQDNK